MVNKLKNLEINKISISKREEIEHFLFRDKIKLTLFIIVSSFLSFYIYFAVINNIKSDKLKSELFSIHQKTAVQLIFLHNYKEDYNATKATIAKLKTEQKKLKIGRNDGSGTVYNQPIFIKTLNETQRQEIINSSKIAAQQNLIYNLQLILKNEKNNSLVLNNKNYNFYQIANKLKNLDRDTQMKALDAVIEALNVKDKIKDKNNFLNAVFQINSLQAYEKNIIKKAKYINTDEVLKQADENLKVGKDYVETKINRYSLYHNKVFQKYVKVYQENLQKQRQIKIAEYQKHKKEIETKIAKFQNKINAHQKVLRAIENLYSDNIINYNSNVETIENLEKKAEKND